MLRVYNEIKCIFHSIYNMIKTPKEYQNREKIKIENLFASYIVRFVIFFNIVVAFNHKIIYPMAYCVFFFKYKKCILILYTYTAFDV